MPSVGSVKRLLELVDCTAILYNILLDVGDDVPDEYLQDIDSGQYWMSEGDGEHHEDHGYVNDNGMVLLVCSKRCYNAVKKDVAKGNAANG